MRKSYFVDPDSDTALTLDRSLLIDMLGKVCDWLFVLSVKWPLPYLILGMATSWYELFGLNSGLNPDDVIAISRKDGIVSLFPVNHN